MTMAGVYEKEAFLPGLTELLAKQGEDAPLSLVIADMDHFGRVNTQHGRKVGDAVLQEVMDLLRESLPPDGAIYRYGAEDLVILLPVEKERAFLWIEEFRRAFDREHTVTAEGKTVSVPLTLSGSVASCPEDGTQPTTLLRNAYDALFRAKRTGRNKVCLAREEKMVTKTSHYTQGQLERLACVAKETKTGEAVLLREALDELLSKYGR